MQTIYNLILHLTKENFINICVKKKLNDQNVENISTRESTMQ